MPQLDIGYTFFVTIAKGWKRFKIFFAGDTTAKVDFTGTAVDLLSTFSGSR
jgi:hypothetical protein